MDNTKTAEEPNAERVLFAKILESSFGEDFISIQDEICKVKDDPAHLVVIASMHEYANQVSAPLKKRIEELEAYLRSAQSILYEEQYTGTAEEIEKILNPSTNGTARC